MVVNYQEIQQLCENIANALNVFGSINIQLINTPKGAYVFEINPRISSTIAMRNAIGFEDVIWLLDELEGKLMIKKQITSHKTMYKICQTIIQ